MAARRAQHTLAGWVVEDPAAAAAELRDRGVAFEEYDLGASDRGWGCQHTCRQAAWCTGSEGNLLGFIQLKKAAAWRSVPFGPGPSARRVRMRACQRSLAALRHNENTAGSRPTAGVLASCSPPACASPRSPASSGLLRHAGLSV
jgi:hypothetical protein